MITYSSAEQVVADSLESLKAFNRDTMYKEQDMCIDYYQFNNTAKYIRKYFSGTLQTEIPLYAVNMTKRLIDRISLVYKNPPERNLEDERYSDLTEDKNFTLKRIERIHNLLGTVALQVIWKDDKFQYVPRLEFEPIFDVDDPMNPVGIVYPAKKTTDSIYQTQEDEYIYWDNERHFRFDVNGNIIHINEEDLNPYGVLPFVFIQPNNQIDEFINEGKGKDICLANCQIDIAMTMLQHHIRKAGGQFVISGNVETNNIELGLNKVVVIDDGTMSNLNPNVDINSIIEGVKFQLQQVAINHHLTFDFGINGSKSGVALKIENIELLEAREDDVEKFRMVENDIYAIETKLLEAHMKLSLPNDFNIDYTEIDFPDPAQEMQQWEFWFKHGIKDKIDYIMENDPDKFESRENAIKWLDERTQQRSDKTNIFSLRAVGENADIV